MAEPQPFAAPAPPPPHGHPASMTPPASADGEKPSSPSYQSHHDHQKAQEHVQQQQQQQQLTSPQLSDLDLDANAGSSPEKTVSEQHDQHGQDEHETKQDDVDVDVDVEDDDDIHPDHYYGGGKIPVFRPTMDQFRDFQAFVRKVDKYGMLSGVIKVIPPQEWLDSLPDLEDPVKSIRVKNPIMQEFHGSHGSYTQANMEKQRSYNLPQWKGVCDEPSHQPPARRGERRRQTQGRPTRGAKAKSDFEKKTKQDKASEDVPDNRSDGSKPEGPPTPVSPQSKPVEAKSEELSDGESLPTTKPKGRQPKSVSARRKYNRGAAAEYIDEEAFKEFDYRLSDPSEFTAERCEELETTYWKSLMYNNPMYAADMPGSLFNDNVTSWNVAKLPNLLDVLGSKVPGVNTAYLYLGMWKATFAWHLEDVDLYSINYIHFGAPKQWYSISQEDLPRFEAAMKQMWPGDAKHCSQFLRHKTYLISPTILKSQFGITVNRMVHYEREFVITFPYGYHSGYNLGYNCAESVNFATEKWLDYGRVAKKCNCESDSVWIDTAEIERKMRGELTPEHDDGIMASDDQLDGASDILTPPRSVPEKSATRVKKRKQEGKESRAKRVKLHVDGPRKIPCVLCPNNLDYEDLLPTEDGKSHAHRRCALYIEETSILKDDSGSEVVCDIDKIPKARLGLKCLFCREIRGACFQCMHGKCARSYHPTCALLAGVQVEFGELAVVADDGCEYAVPGVDLKCKYHRPKKYTPASSESWEMDPKIVEMVTKQKAGNLVQFQADKEINGAVVLDNRQSERSLLLKVLPRGDVIELPYQWIVVVKKSNFLPLPAGIKPLPAHLARKADSKGLASSLPSHGTPFADANSMHQWAEFSCTNPPSNPDLILPNLFKPTSLWHYLGKTSTECRAQYTDDPAKPVHNPRSNFLDSIKSLRAPHPQPPIVSSSSNYQRPHAAPPAPKPWPAVGERPRPPMPPSIPPANRPVHPPSQLSSQTVTQASVQPPTQPTTQTSVQPPAQSTTQPTSQPTTTNNTTSQSMTSQPMNRQSGSAQPGTNHAVNNKLAVWNLGDRSAQLGMARRLVTSITDHANHCAGYTIVDPGFAVQTLLGPSGAEPPKNGLDKLRKAMSESKVQAKSSSKGLLPLRPLNMESDEVDHLLRMLRFAILNLTNKNDPMPLKPTEKTKPEPPKQPRDPFPNPMGWAYLEIQKRHTTPVYRSPYAPGFGFTEYAKQEYGLSDVLRPARRESLSADFFAKLSPEDQEKVIQACGNAAPSSKKEGMGMDDPVDQAMGLGDAQIDDLAQPPATAAAPMDAMQTDDHHHLSVFDMTLRSDSPASSFTKMQFHYQSPQDFSSHVEHEASILPKHLNEHHDLFGDQQADQRFWASSAPWTTTAAADGEGVTGSYAAFDEEHRPFFGPHLKPGHDYAYAYAASDMDIERGPASLHSMDMAGFGFDGADDIGTPQ